MDNFFADFHFLRPWSLLGFLPVIGLVSWNLYLKNRSNAIQDIIAPHLLPHLLVKSGKDQSLQPLPVLLVFWVLTVIALAGPTWRQESSLFWEDQAALVIVIKVTPSMLAKDIKPSRLERSVHKISDLLAIRAGARTALVAYSGSAHQVMPLTRDDSVIVHFARALVPEIMPKVGDAVVEALDLAGGILKEAGVSGSILLIADNIGEEHHPGLRVHAQDNGFPVQILAIAAQPGMPIPSDSPPAPAFDRSAMHRVAEIIGGKMTLVSADSSDVKRINRAIVRCHQEMPRGGVNKRWQDSGYLLVFVLFVLSLFWCRRGWFVRWES